MADPVELTELTTEVTNTVGVMASAKVLIDGIAERLAAAGVDPAKLQTLRSDLSTGSGSLAAAVAANQPAAGGIPVIPAA